MKLNFKAVARSNKTGNFEFYKDVYTDGESVFIDAKHRGSDPVPLKPPVIELWMQVEPEGNYMLIWERSKEEE